MWLTKILKGRFFILCTYVFLCVCGLQLWYKNYDRLLRSGIDARLSNLRTLLSLKKPNSDELPNHLSPDDDVINMFNERHQATNSPYASSPEESYLDFLHRLDLNMKPGLTLTLKMKGDSNRTDNSWQRFYKGVTQYRMYDPTKIRVFQDLIHDLSTQRIVSTERKGGGTQFKLHITFADGSEGIFKPGRLSPDYEPSPDTLFFLQLENHRAEIATFHLDRILGFYRAVPAVGRILNITSEILELADSYVVGDSYVSSDGRVCFTGHCPVYCDTDHAYCGNPDMLEGVVLAKFPWHVQMDRRHRVHPWKRFYGNGRAPWEGDEKYCDTDVRVVSPYNNSRVLLDLMDTSVLDFLTGNADRHHYEVFKEFAPDSFVIHFDHGRGFGRSDEDCLSCLTPLTQCCMIRLSTMAKLIKLHQGPDRLSDLMRATMNSDPLAPILVEPQLAALDRRLDKVISAVGECLDKGKTWDTVVIDDGV